MPADRVKLLTDLGFEFTPRSSKWDMMYERLKKYAQEHDGKTTVKKKDDPKLADWVNNMRRRHPARGIASNRYPLNEERVARLNELNFEWAVAEAVPWEGMLERLKTYRDTIGNGSCNVPARYGADQRLANWVNTQRSDFRRQQLPEAKVKALEAEGFQWLAQPERGWEIMLNKLKAYKDSVGHANVPSTHKDDPRLARWVGVQRTQYNANRLREDRAQALEELGFEWYVQMPADSKSDEPHDFPPTKKSSTSSTGRRNDEVTAADQQQEHFIEI